MARTVTWEEGLVMDSIDPADVASYDIDVTSFLEGDAITGVSAVGTNITVSDTTFAGFIITVLVSAGTTGARAKVRFQVTTATETHNRSFFIPIKSL
tara:strand:+ start:1958 stop:2248 length:291 start_codon:yes stop_codon:yes gene_type:complete